MKLMAIPGPSGGEAEVADFIRRQLRGTGAAALVTDRAHRKTRLEGNTGNLILKLPGTCRGPRRLFVAHMDTVPLCVGAKPVRRGGKIVSAATDTGLGADDRSGVAVLLHTARVLLTENIPHPPLTFLWTVQEERGTAGARHVALSLLGRVRLAFNFDGGGPHKLTVGATGGYRLSLHVEGHASHAGNAPEQGVSAVAITSLAIADLVRGGWHGQIDKDGCSGTSNVGVIQGGRATNVVADSVIVRAEARSHDARFRQRIVRKIEASFRQAAGELPNCQGRRGKIHVEGHLDYEAFCLPLDDPSSAAADAAVRAVGRQPTRAVANGGLDANWLTARGIPTVSLGAGQRNIHTIQEQLDVADYLDACRIALCLAQGGP